ncbi:hypothetical protein HDU85_005618 [Gaertneriomyces sp. JEL0708]|nr:hypothetical protein HDU85_005618 [Gaertneriomyces sp. JEL0708]
MSLRSHRPVDSLIRVLYLVNSSLPKNRCPPPIPSAPTEPHIIDVPSDISLPTTPPKPSVLAEALKDVDRPIQRHSDKEREVAPNLLWGFDIKIPRKKYLLDLTREFFAAIKEHTKHIDALKSNALEAYDFLRVPPKDPWIHYTQLSHAHALLESCDWKVFTAMLRSTVRDVASPQVCLDRLHRVVGDVRYCGRWKEMQWKEWNMIITAYDKWGRIGDVSFMLGELDRLCGITTTTGETNGRRTTHCSSATTDPLPYIVLLSHYIRSNAHPLVIKPILRHISRHTHRTSLSHYHLIRLFSVLHDANKCYITYQYMIRRRLTPSLKTYWHILVALKRWRYLDVNERGRCVRGKKKLRSDTVALGIFRKAQEQYQTQERAQTRTNRDKEVFNRIVAVTIQILSQHGRTAEIESILVSLHGQSPSLEGVSTSVYISILTLALRHRNTLRVKEVLATLYERNLNGREWCTVVRLCVRYGVTFTAWDVWRSVFRHRNGSRHIETDAGAESSHVMDPLTVAKLVGGLITWDVRRAIQVWEWYHPTQFRAEGLRPLLTFADPYMLNRIIGAYEKLGQEEKARSLEKLLLAEHAGRPHHDSDEMEHGGWTRNETRDLYIPHGAWNMDMDEQQTSNPHALETHHAPLYPSKSPSIEKRRHRVLQNMYVAV